MKYKILNWKNYYNFNDEIRSDNILTDIRESDIVKRIDHIEIKINLALNNEPQKSLLKNI